MTTTRTSLVLFLLALFAVGCDGTGATEDGGLDGCELGGLGCASAAGDRCATTADGESLVCEEGLCVTARCIPGARACVCRGGTACDDDGTTCTAGVCRPDGCAAGDEGCECLLGGCGPDLFCDTSLGGGTCVDATGFPGGPCPEEGLCRQTSRCDNTIGVCVPCSPGSSGCVPNAGVCNEGLTIVAGRCVPPPPRPPADPVCHTPCREDLVRSDGTFRACVAGFIEGCIDDQTCVEGSCVEPGDEVPSCTTESDCPSFQTCIAGQCYSTCERESECPTGLRCRDLVCRAPCTFPSTPENACPAGTFCDSPDARGGVCMPQGAPDLDAEAGGVPAVFELSAEALSLGRGTASVEIDLLDAPFPETFTVERVSHRGFDREGNLVEEEIRSEGGDPLSWIQLAFGTAVADDDLELVVDPRCESGCPALEIRNAPPSAARGLARWEGTLRVVHPRLGERSIILTWSEGISGEWTGSMRYFANFDDRGVAEWSAGDRNRAPATLRNALLLRWIAFRNGALAGGSRELAAVLTATATGTWAQGGTREACAALTGNDDGACYLYDARPEGVEVYTANLNARPVPSGMMELPIGLSLRASVADDRQLEGRINSEPSPARGRPRSVPRLSGMRAAT